MSLDSVTRTESAPILEDSATREDMEAKRVLARQMMEGYVQDKNEAKAVSLLEECVAQGDADALVMLAKWCALACGMKYDAGRAEALVSEAAKKGNHEARILLRFINDWKGKQRIDLKSS